jgi:hypothetical protein
MAARSTSRVMLVAALTLMTLAQIITLSGTARAAGNVTYPVFVLFEADDPVGINLVHRVREGFRASIGFPLVEQRPDAVWIVRLITLRKSEAKDATVHAVVWTIHDRENDMELYVHSKVGICAANRIETCATSVVADTDRFNAMMLAGPPIKPAQ